MQRLACMMVARLANDSPKRFGTARPTGVVGSWYKQAASRNRHHVPQRGGDVPEHRVGYQGESLRPTSQRQHAS
jgi:hypothetical protein